MNWIFKSFPSYAIPDAIGLESRLPLMSFYRNNTDGNGIDISPNPWDFNNLLGTIISIPINAIIWTLVLFFIESQWKCCLKIQKEVNGKRSKVIDDDVDREKKRVASGLKADIIVNRFTKEFTKLHSGCC